MIKKFNNFDADEFLSKKKALKEAVDSVDVVDDKIDNDTDGTPKKEYTEKDVIDGTPVYENPFLLKIAKIISRRLDAAKIGEFGIYTDIVYLNGVPGVWFYGLDDNNKNIVCCRDSNKKTISLFKEFDVNVNNTAIVTYSTEKLGFKDMIDQLIYDLTQTEPIVEGVINEAIRYGAGWTIDYVRRFEKLSDSDKDYVYNFVRTYGEKQAIEEYYTLVNSGDPTACRILKAYVGRDLSDGDGQSRYLINLANAVICVATGGKPANSVIKAISAGVLDGLVKMYKGGGPAIATTSGVEYETTDDEDTLDVITARETARAKEIEESTKKYRRTLRKMELMAQSMCRYVKQNGKLDDDDASAMPMRGMFITGKGGTGKSYTIEEVLEREHMVKGRDYVNIASGSSSCESLYNYLYQYNDKLIIFDDSSELFSEPKKISLWKVALQTEGTTAEVVFPNQALKDSNAKLYKTGVLTRQERYFKEMGRKSKQEWEAYRDKRLKELFKELGSDYTKDNAMTIIKEEWKQIKEDVTPLMPDRFIFNGLVIVIGNDTREVMRKEVGAGHWSAIIDRFQDFDVSPESVALWRVIKEKILKQYADTTIPDKLCTIPRDLTEEFIEEVDKLLEDPRYQTITWRVVKAFGSKILRGKYGLEDWKDTLKEKMATDK